MCPSAAAAAAETLRHPRRAVRRAPALTAPSRLPPRAASGAAAAPPAAAARPSWQPAEPVVFSPEGALPRPMKLSVVLKDALRRWYLEAERDAARGDAKALAMQAQMLMEGYGCEADPALGRELAEKARRRGYRMAGVYCEI